MCLASCPASFALSSLTPLVVVSPTSPSPAALYGIQDAASSHGSTLDLASSAASTPRPVLQRLPSDTSSSYSQVGPTTPASATFPPPPATPQGGAALTSSADSNHKLPRQSTIRFAPLPEIRPRSYSTGHNVWVVDEDDGEGEGGQQRTRLVRVGSDVEHDDDYDDDALEFSPDDDEGGDEGRGSSIKWGSWSDTLSGGMWGLSPSTSRRSNLSSTEDDAVSLSSSAEGYAGGGVGSVTSGGSGGSSKLLKAFGLGGLAGVKGKKGRRAPGGGGEDDVLARTSSGESQLSRRSSVDASSAAAAPVARPKGTTGIPLRKASTWEVGDAPESAASRASAAGGGSGGGGGPVYYASPARSTRRRANYPPVAQRSRTAGGWRGRGPPVVRVEEPKFSEWGGAGVGSRSTGGGGGGVAGEDDDGSGMAWLKKRRLEREKAEREKAEREAREAAEEGGAKGDEEGQAPSGDGDAREDEPRAATPPPAMAGAQSLPLPSQLEAFRRGRQPPSRSGTLDSTVSSASTIRPSTPTQTPPKPSSPVVGGLSATRPALVIEVPSQPSSSASSPDGDETPVTSPVGDDDEEEADSGSDEDEEEEAEESDDDDDLDEEELAREEALAEEARRSAKSMGAFLFSLRLLPP